MSEHAPKQMVRVPGVGIVGFPADMPEAEIQKTLAEFTQKDRGTFGRAVGSATEIVGKSILPTAGGAVGGFMGGPAGMALGSGAGELANQALGFTEPSATDALVATVMPSVVGGAARLGGAAAKAAIRRLPGAAFTMHEMAAESLGKIPGSLAPAQSSDELYALVSKFNPKIKADQLKAAAERLAATEEGLSKGLSNDEIRNVGRGLVNLIDQNGGEVPFDVLRTELRRIGERVGSSARTGGEPYGAYKDLFKQGYNDLEKAAGAGNEAMPAVQALKQANAARKMEFVVDDLSELFSVKGGGISPRPDGAGVQVNFRKIITAVERNEDIKKTLGADAYKAMVDDLTRMWKATPNLPAVAGTDAGSKRILQSTGAFGGLGTAAGMYFGGPTGAVIGGGLGGAAGAAGPAILGRLVATSTGRKVLQGMLESNGGSITPEMLSLLGVAVGMSQPGREVTHMGTDFAQGVMGR